MPDKKTEEEPKKSKKKLIVIVAIVLVVAVAGYMVLGKKPPKAAAGPPKPGLVVPEGSLTVNLAGGHYLEVKPNLQLPLGEPTTAIATDTAEITDAMIVALSGKSMAAFTGAAGIARAEKDLMKAIDKQLPGKVYDILFTQFVMQ